MSRRRPSQGSKWMSTAASIWIQSTSGSSYCFPLYSSLLKSSQSYTQSTLDAVASFKDAGANVGVLSGLLLSSSNSPSTVLAVGALQCFAGYLMIWLSVTGRVANPPVPVMCLYMFIAAHAQTFFNTADVVTAVGNFAGSRGTAVGIMKGFLGLSGAILIQVYHTMFAGKPSNFLLMLALLPCLLPLVLMWLVNVYDKEDKDDTKFLNGFSIISLVVAAYLMVLIIWENILPMRMVSHVITFVMLLLLLASPLWIVVNAQMRETTVDVEQSTHKAPLLEDSAPLDHEQHMRSEKAEAEISYTQDNNEHIEILEGDCHSLPDRHERELDILQAMQTLDFWLLFIAMACGMGSGLATVNNISQIGASLKYTSLEISTMVSLWSIWNFLGRFGAGYTSDYFLKSRGYARPVFIVLTLASMSVGHLTISSGLPGALYVGSVLVGVCYGCQWSLMPTITSELFGVMHMGTIFNAISIASPLGSYILSVRVVGYIYDMEASASGMETCIGFHCFRLSFIVMACVSVFGSGVALFLFFRTRNYYKQVVIKRLHHMITP